MQLAKRLPTLAATLVSCSLILLSACGAEPVDADYCNILLIPELAEEIGLDLETRIRLAQKGSRLLRYLSGRERAPHDPGLMNGASTIADAMGSSRIERDGRETRLALPREANEEFLKRFARGKLARVTYRTEAAKSGSGRDRYWLTFGWEDVKQDDANESLGALESQLYEAHGLIPSVEEAFRLFEHEDSVLSSAARRWLTNNGYGDEVRRRLRAEHDEREQERQERSTARRQQMREEFEEKRRDMQERFEERRRQRDEEFEEKRRKMREEHREKYQERSP